MKPGCSQKSIVCGTTPLNTIRRNFIEYRVDAEHVLCWIGHVRRWSGRGCARTLCCCIHTCVLSVISDALSVTRGPRTRPVSESCAVYTRLRIHTCNARPVIWLSSYVVHYESPTLFLKQVSKVFVINLALAVLTLWLVDK